MTQFVLIDGGMIRGANALLPEPEAPPGWLIPLYPEPDAARYGPILIDVEAARASCAIETVRAATRALQPALHVSGGHSGQPFAALAEHLRQYTRIADERGDVLYLRLADCCVLEHLPRILTREQWAAVAGPMQGWSLTGRDGQPIPLPLPDPGTQPVDGPLMLTDAQIEALIDTAEPDRLMTHVEDKHGVPLMPHHKQYQVVQEVVGIWRACGARDRGVLEKLAEAALLTQGRAPGLSELRDKLTGEPPEAICLWLDGFCRQVGA